MHFLDQKIKFPDVSEASAEGLLAMGGDLSAERLLHAYSHGIFPWYDNSTPILWWSPDPRFVLFPKDLKVSKKTQKLIDKNIFKVTENKDFEAVITQCAKIKRPNQEGTWINEDMINAYINLHYLGYAKSIEVWQNNTLVGGLYGVDMGNAVFSGESMFSKVSNASKVGFISFVRQKRYKLIDCQIHTTYLENLGAVNLSRAEFLKLL